MTGSLFAFLLLISLQTALASESAEDISTTGSNVAGVISEFERHGSGPQTLLLIPCMSCRWESWQGFMQRNQDRYTMIAVTLPGFGGTPVPALPMNSNGTPWRENALTALSQLIDQEGLKDITLVAHSFGTMVAVQLAARRPDRVVAMVNVDGTIESTSWAPATADERLARANSVVEEWGSKFTDAAQWQKFNNVGLPAGELVDRERALEAIRRHGSFMATPKPVLLQYWRENLLIDLTTDMKKLDIPILDIKALVNDPETVRRQHLADLKKAGVPAGVKTIFMYMTSHFVMIHRPLVLDSLISKFISGETITDFHPEILKQTPNTP